MQATILPFAEALAFVQHELLLFAAFFLAIGLVDELAIDAIYVWNRISGKAVTRRANKEQLVKSPLSGTGAVFIPTWQEASVIGATIAYALSVWRQRELRIYVGCYRNDPATVASAMVAARRDTRVRIVIVGEDGPTSKAHCLNRLYQALQEDELRGGYRAHMVVLHDAEDMVDPAALPLLDREIWDADFVQLPVMALPPSDSRWVASHYSDEFAEAHAKAMVVRNSLNSAIPGAGVGCAIARAMLDRLADQAGGRPFPEGSLTEDYEVGLRVHAMGGTGRFLRVRDEQGRLIATRAYFPERIDQSVRQKTRWTLGIALQGWDRLGWQGSIVQRWMTLRDRRGPLAAFLLFLAYFLIGVTSAVHLLAEAGMVEQIQPSPMLSGLLLVTFAGLLWRLAMRCLFTAREYGLRQGLLAIPRTLVSNVIAIMSGRRALAAYIRSLRGTPLAWDKTEHMAHPVLLKDKRQPA